MVYFDNLQVSNIHARIIEENHYYAYGLKIAGISSRKLPDPAEGHTSNKDLYNDKELWDEADLNWYDYGFRNYDPQIGRFPQLDPLTDDYTELTPYQYASCDPIKNIDLDGLEGIGSLVTVGASQAAVTAGSQLSEVIITGAAKKVAAKAGGKIAGRIILNSIPSVLNASMKALINKPVIDDVNVGVRPPISLNSKSVSPFISLQAYGEPQVGNGDGGDIGSYARTVGPVTDWSAGFFFKFYKPSAVEGILTSKVAEKVIKSAEAVTNFGERVEEIIEKQKWRTPALSKNEKSKKLFEKTEYAEPSLFSPSGQRPSSLKKSWDPSKPDTIIKYKIKHKK